MNLQRSEAHDALDHHHARTAERIVEIAEILAAGLMRLTGRKSSEMSQSIKENSLDILAAESGHPSRRKTRNAR
jgi:hypothetical protein